jgi:Cu(I)/Ag(I) efflux system membrane protein CusA/SilA
MAVSAILVGLLPLMWCPLRAGAYVMKRIATPTISGIVTSAIMEILIYPVILVLWRKRGLKSKTRVKSRSFYQA